MLLLVITTWKYSTPQLCSFNPLTFSTLHSFPSHFQSKMSITQNLTTSISSSSSAFLAPSTFNSRYFCINLTSFLIVSLFPMGSCPLMLFYNNDSKLHLSSVYLLKFWFSFVGVGWGGCLRLLQESGVIACEESEHL